MGKNELQESFCEQLLSEVMDLRNEIVSLVYSPGGLDATVVQTTLNSMKVDIHISHRGINIDYGINLDQHLKPRNKCK
jgi:hypothetical protein